MKLQINGEERDLPDGLTLAALLEQLAMKPDRVAIELNREIVRREHWPQVHLKDGDRLEIVQFVGGGSGGCRSLVQRDFKVLPQSLQPCVFAGK